MPSPSAFESLLGWVGRRGKAGGAVLGVLAVALTLAVFARGFDDYAPGQLVKTGGLLLMLYLMAIGLTLGGNVWKQDDRFPPMTLPQLKAALDGFPRPYVVCLDCRLLVPYESSAGMCPRCEQTSSCLEVNGPQDIVAVRNALPDA